MKNITLLISLFVVIASATAQEINWMSLNEALAAQKKEPKKIIMDVYTNWCGPCKMLDKNTFQNPDVSNYINKNFYAVKFNGEGNEEITYMDKKFKNPGFDPEKTNTRNSAHQFASYLRVSAYPTMVFLDEKGGYISPVVGYKTPQQLELYLKIFNTDKYKEFKSKEEFQKYFEDFQPEFVN